MNLKKIGIIGDGQLARMLIQAGHNLYEELEFYVYPLGKASESPCLGLCTLVNTYKELFELSDIVTYEFENLPVPKIREALQGPGLKPLGVEIIPSLDLLERIQSKISQKIFYQEHQIPTASFQVFPTGNDIKDHLELNQKRDFIIKRDRGGYNGLGVFNLEKSEPNNLEQFLSADCGYLLEEKVKIDREIGIMVVKDDSRTLAFNPVEMVFKEANILDYYYTPETLSENILEKAKALAIQVVDAFGENGLFGLELFLDKDQKLLVNEISPRPHNSGHHTIESSEFSQYTQLIKVLLGIPLNETNQERKAIMANVLGPNFNGPCQFDSEKVFELLEKGIAVHDYGKKINKPGRKMGHLTVVYDDDNSEALALVRQYKDQLVIPLKKSTKRPIVGVIMGSISDAQVVKPAIEILKKFGVEHEVGIMSAHRMPKEMYHYALSARENCLKVIIACAGGAAHLPGMVASLTTLPVIGLPAKTSTMSGLDSLYSIVQMPRGIPVATVAINNGVNAGLLAVRTLSIDTGLDYLGLHEKLGEYAKDNCQKSKDSNQDLLKELY